MLFSAVKSTSTYLWLFVLLRLGRAQFVSNNSQTRDVNLPTRGLHFPTTTAIPTPAILPSYFRLRRASSRQVTTSCSAPPQPVNGERKLDRYFCQDNSVDCNIPEGTTLEPGAHLIYRCNEGHDMNGNTDVYCSRGRWSPIPKCVEVKCGSLNSVSTIMVSCTRFGNWVNCDSPMIPQTQVEIACRSGYKKDTEFVSTRRSDVTCNIGGQWEPEPIKCVAACGLPITHQRPYVSGGTVANVGDFPWHATLYVQKSARRKRKDFTCGATIIQTNIALTAAHCVYDERTRTTTDPGRLFLLTGNTFRDYDASFHDPQVVRNATVKYVHTHCSYYGLTGNYASDIAMLELEHPLEFSSILLPACLDDTGYSERFLQSGAFGRVAGFGRTATGESSAILQTLTIPYLPNSQCKASDSDIENEVFITNDKFCAGYTNGSAVCEGDSGGGLVFKKGDLWYVMGIVSVGLGVNLDNGEKTCKTDSYSLYTRVPIYMSWIQDVLFSVERNRPHHSCSHHSITPIATPATPVSTATLPSVTKPNIVPPVTNWWDDLTTGAPGGTTSSTVTSSPINPTKRPDTGRGAIARQKCTEYSQYANMSCPTSITHNQRPIYLSSALDKVKAIGMEFPHMAAVGFDSENDTIIWLCGGTLISEQFVLTTSHCTRSRTDGNAAWVRVGDLNLDRSDDGATPENRRIIERIIHPEYNRAVLYHDIALLRLESRVPFNDWIRPACLHTAPSVGTDTAIATGWGALDWHKQPTWSDLTKVTLPVIDAQTCNAKWTSDTKNLKLPNGIIESQMICAGAVRKDTCQGDSGGPLVIPSQKHQCMWEIIGIISAGKSCGFGVPAIHIRVYNYVPWIEAIVWGLG